MSLVLFLWGMINIELKTTIQLALFFFGLLFFTFAEYLIHRFVFHSGEYTNRQNWQLKIHGIHHETPQDKERLALPLPLAILYFGSLFLPVLDCNATVCLLLFSWIFIGLRLLSFGALFNSYPASPKKYVSFAVETPSCPPLPERHSGIWCYQPALGYYFQDHARYKKKEITIKTCNMSNHNGMAIAIAWPEFIGKQPGSWYDKPMRWLGHNKNFQYKVGHASLLLVDSASGSCSYFDCGRYHAPYQHGRIRDRTTDANLEIHTKATFSKNKIANIKELLHEVQRNKSTFGTGPLYASYCAVNMESTQSKIKELQSKNAIPFGPFVINGINCCRFVRSGILSGAPALKYRLKLSYLWPFKPMPITTVNCLSDKIIIPELATDDPDQHHSNSYTKENVKDTLPTPEKPKNIPLDSQWLGGEVAGGWFWLKPINDGYLINRYSSEGIRECTGKFVLAGSGFFNIRRPFSFTYLSHCSKVTILQDDEIFEFLRDD